MQDCAPSQCSAFPGSLFPHFGPISMPPKEQAFWPDSSTQFDAAPFAFLLRRTFSESNLSKDEHTRAHPSTAMVQRRQRSSLLSTSSAASTSAQPRRGRRMLRSLPSSPQTSRPNSPIMAAAMASARPPRPAAEVLYDAQRALIVGEESKAFVHVRGCGLPSVVLLDEPLLAVQAIPFRMTCARFLPFVAPEHESPDDVFAPALLPLLSTMKDHSKAWASIIDGILEGRSKNAAVLYCEDRQSLGAAGVGAKENLRRAIAQLLQRHPHTRALVMDWDLHCPTDPPSWEPTPGLLHIGFSRSQGIEVPHGNGLTTINVLWPRDAAVCDPDALAAIRTLVMPLAQALAPDIVLFNVSFSPELTAGAFSRIVRALMGASQGKMILHARIQVDRLQSLECVTACMATLLGDDLVGLETPDLCCDLPTMGLLENVIAATSTYWPCLQNALGFRLLSEKQFYTIRGDDTVTATVALASLSMSCLREEDEEGPVQQRKRTLSDSVPGAAAALLKVRNSCSSPSNS